MDGWSDGTRLNLARAKPDNLNGRNTGRFTNEAPVRECHQGQSRQAQQQAGYITAVRISNQKPDILAKRGSPYIKLALAMNFQSHSNRASPTKTDLIGVILKMTEVDTLHGFLVIDGGLSDREQTLVSGPRDFGLYRKPQQELPRDEVPDYIWHIVEREPAAHLIWLSEKVLDEEEIRFAWIVAHECGHVRQTALSRSLTELRRSIRRLRQQPQFRYLPPTLMGTDEIDSDLLAMQVTERIFGEDSLREFLARCGISRCPFPQYPAFLRELNCIAADVEGVTK